MDDMHYVEKGEPSTEGGDIDDLRPRPLTASRRSARSRSAWFTRVPRSSSSSWMNPGNGRTPISRGGIARSRPRDAGLIKETQPDTARSRDIAMATPRSSM